MCVTYESVILFGVVFFFAYGFSSLTQFKGAPGPLRDAFQWFMFVVLGAYFSYFWSDGRRSLPMKTLSLRIERADGANLGPWRAGLRYMLTCGWFALVLLATRQLSPWLAVLVVLPWLGMPFEARRRSLIDLLCGTQLVVLAPAGSGPAGPATA